MATTKKSTYIHKSIVCRKGEPNASVTDTLRRYFGKYWVLDSDSGTEYGSEEVNTAALYEGGLNVFFGSTTEFSFPNSPFYGKKQEVYIRPEGERYSGSQQAFEMSVGALVPSAGPSNQGRFIDFSFVCHKPLNKVQAEGLGEMSALGYFNIDFEYNFYVADFERSLEMIPEHLLPNIYAFISNQIDGASKNMSKLLTLGNKISKSQAVLQSSTTRQDEEKLNWRGIRSVAYYLRYTQAYREMSETYITNFKELYRNFIFPFENLGLVSDTSMKSQFPMYTEIEFSTDRTTTVGQILEDANLSTSLLRHISASGYVKQLYSTRHLGLKNLQIVSATEDMSSDSANTVRIESKKYETIDLLVWWRNYLSGKIPKTVFKKQTIVGPKAQSVYVSSGVDNNDLSQAINCLVFSGKMKEVIKSNLRSYEDIWNGKSCNSETTLYCVEKSDRTGEVIQKYWFPNSNNIDVIKFVDTQVKYGEKYTYSIFAYQMVFAEEYSYGPVNYQPPTPYVTIYEPCPEFPYPALNGLSCIPGTAGGDSPTQEIVGCIQQDAEALKQVVYPSLEVNTSDPYEMMLETVKAYVAVNKVSALSSGVYVGVLLAFIADAYGSTLEKLMSSLGTVLTNYLQGEITYPDLNPQPEVVVEFNESEFSAMTVATTVPILKIVKIPYFERSGYILDSPPVFPDVNIVPYRAQNNKLLFWLNSNIGEYDLYPVALSAEEEQMISIYKEKNNLSPSDPIRYKSDDPVREFQIFRITEKPESYLDFASNQRAQIETFGVTSDYSQIKASSASYVDSVDANTKYYYMFRSVDVHGQVSYPSPVFEVELMDNDGAVYPIIKIIPVEQAEKPSQATKEARRYMHIVPRVTQGIFNEQASGLGPESASAVSAKSYSLGIEQERLWGKKFKIRFISKSTGRKIDLNVTYNTKHVVTPTENAIKSGEIPS